MRDTVKRALPGWALRFLGWRRDLAFVWRKSRLTTRPLRFMAGELLRRDEAARRWTLRNGANVLLRRGSRDTDILVEIFDEEIYKPPPQVMAVLNALGRPVRIVDLGANVGLFGVDALQRFPESTIEAFEPDPTNVPLLRAAVAASGHSDRWQIHPVAAGTESGTVRFAAGNKSDSFVVNGDTHLDTIDVEVRDVMPVLAAADYVKIDIEGAEWSLLDDPRFAGLGLRVIAMEYHPRDNPPPDPRTAAETRLTALGFELQEVQHFPHLGGVGQLWAWRTGD